MSSLAYASCPTTWPFSGEQPTKRSEGGVGPPATPGYPGPFAHDHSDIVLEAAARQANGVYQGGHRRLRHPAARGRHELRASRVLEESIRRNQRAAAERHWTERDRVGSALPSSGLRTCCSVRSLTVPSEPSQAPESPTLAPETCSSAISTTTAVDWPPWPAVESRESMH